MSSSTPHPTPSNAKSSYGIPKLPFPESKEEADLVENVFTKQLEELPYDEHEKIIFDMHGIDRTDQGQDPNFVNHQLARLDEELDLIENKQALEIAEQANRSCLGDPLFRLSFLRCTEFQAKEAAQLMVTHFEKKRELFQNDDLLGRDIRISDLSPMDIEMLNVGFIQMFPVRDVSDRAVICAGAQLDRVDRTEQACRAMWYYLMAVHKEEKMQKGDIVVVFYNYGGFPEEVSINQSLSEVYQMVPLRLVGAHYCSDGDFSFPYAAGIRLALYGDEHRLRKHAGSIQEVEFALQTFGIPTQHSPMKKDGSWCLAWHKKWLLAQRERETRESRGTTYESEAVVLPNRSDVLFGRGKFTREHTGNLHLIHLCEKRAVEYEAADKREKTEIARQLVSMVHQSDGRFLKWKDHGWVEATDIGAREKVSHFFRHLRSKSALEEAARESETKKRQLRS